MTTYTMKPVRELRAGDVTRWYEVKADAEVDPIHGEPTYRVLVRHADTGHTDYVRGPGNEPVPVAS